MFRTSFLATIMFAAPLFAESQTDRDAQAALALAAAARKTHPVTTGGIDPKAPLSYLEAVAWTKARRLPVLVSVGGIDCQSLCPHLRPEIPVTHAAALCGDSSPRLQLVIADKAGDLWTGKQWVALPTESEVRAAAHQLDKAVNAPKSDPKPNAGIPALPRAAAPNVGRCSCGDGRCFCLPASKCPGGCPAKAAPVAGDPVCPDGNCPVPARGFMRR